MLPTRLLPALRKCTFPSCFPTFASLSGVLHATPISSSLTCSSQWRLVNLNLWSFSRHSFIRHPVISLHVRSKYSQTPPLEHHRCIFSVECERQVFTLIQMSCTITVFMHSQGSVPFQMAGRKVKYLDFDESNKWDKVIKMNQLDATMIYWSIRSAQPVSGNILPIIRSVRLRYLQHKVSCCCGE